MSSTQKPLCSLEWRLVIVLPWFWSDRTDIHVCEYERIYSNSCVQTVVKRKHDLKAVLGFFASVATLSDPPIDYMNEVYIGRVKSRMWNM